MENSAQNHINKSPELIKKSIQKNNYQSSQDFPQFSIVSSNNRKTYKGPEHPSKRWGHSVVLHNNNMIIFGGRHSQRILSNIYSLDFTSLSWSKIEPCGNSPPARDSHSAIIYNDSDMIIFGGNGTSGKLNDLWNFNFNDKKWTKISGSGKSPSSRDGHLTSLIYNKYMMIYAGLDNEDNVVHDIFLFDIENRIWYECDLEGVPIQNKDGQSCCKIGDLMYLFGGQGPEDDEYSNDLFTLKFDIPDNLKDPKNTKKPKAIIANVEINNNNLRPKVRASQTCVGYKDQYLIIIGGEGKTQIPLDDIWLFDLKTKAYTEIELLGEEKIEGRFCHSCLVYGDILALYGGMQNSEVTLDNLTVLSIESKQNQKNVNNISKNKNKKFDMLSSNNKKKKIDNNGNKNKNDANISDSNKIYENDNIDNDMEDFAADTNDLININFYSLKELKKNYLNNLMTWNFLKSLSDFYKWPIGCIGNFIKNSLKENINSKNINIDFKKYKNDEIYFSIKDDGIGMTCSEFNGVMFSFIKNQNKELNYFQYGFSMKAAALRLANNFLIISKTIKEISIGMISIELQKKINDKNCDFILTPIVNYRIEKKDNNKNNGHKYIPKSNFPIESINLILEIIPFLFKSNDDLMKYFDSFETGTHIYLFDLKTIKNEENGYLKTIKEDNSLNKSILSNYEILFDEEENDIYLNEDIGLNDELKKNIIDFSLKKYLSFLYLKHNKHTNIFIFGKKIEIENPYYNIKLMSYSGNNMEQITNLIYSKEDKNENKKDIIDSFNIEGSDYNGILFNEKFIDSISSDSSIGIEEIKEKDYLNGILLYKDNILVSRLNQSFLGDITFFIKKMMNINKTICKNENKYNKCNNLNKKIFKRNGYLQLPIAGYELMFNNMEIKDQALFGFIYNKIKILLKKLQK
jgi:hypothetical protein